MHPPAVLRSMRHPSGMPEYCCNGTAGFPAQEWGSPTKNEDSCHPPGGRGNPPQTLSADGAALLSDRHPADSEPSVQRPVQADNRGCFFEDQVFPDPRQFRRPRKEGSSLQSRWDTLYCMYLQRNTSIVRRSTPQRRAPANDCWQCRVRKHQNPILSPLQFPIAQSIRPYFLYRSSICL